MRTLKFSYILEHYSTKKRREVIFNYNEVLIGVARNTLNYLDFERVIANREFTGMQDRNGNDIYVDDIVMINDINQYGKVKKFKYRIEFIQGSFMATMINSEYENVYPKSIKNQPEMEIVGNKYQHPELLETKKEEA